MSTEKHRPIRSFVLRTGRMTPGQERAYEEHWERWGLEHSAGALDFGREFNQSASRAEASGVDAPGVDAPGVDAPGVDAPRVLEIGFGMGASLVEMAAAAPEKNFVGIEVHKPGVGRLLHSMADAGVDNIRVYCHDAVEVLRDCIADGSLDTVQIFFPDPWHKKRHHKRRLIQPGFVADLIPKLKPGGVLHLATDWENYAEQMMEVLSAAQDLENCVGEGEYAARPEHRPLTKFEARGERLGHGVWDLLFRRV
ncbi:tRNA (guanosine(46)-N7)-methyltransferase TrmB [Halioglobus maricola]|uniref:tRNA (guanine-N(7)-)-methyltransferase n=1 Tax=Halioglobus maricola TaxID=2601894 RepID=A0A5P9NQN0_9GAMM|nr:tRNA (guanosine(46)-N7)-methyltransferase TrmB [Halioglobus maricola]QFU77614.1 tRNA (guanosine(46)-N7)-methyltransferase TrmB [Halioglobus maricola]